MSVSVQNTSASLSGKTLAKLEDNQTFTGQKTFDVGASAPFVCVSGAAKVDNLDADKLDGQEGTYYTNASNLASGTVPVARVVAADPNADRQVFWDDSAGALAFMTLTNLAIRGTGLIASQSTPCGRLSLTSGTPVTSADVTAAGTLYYALYKGNTIPLYNGTTWEVFTIAELSIAVPAVATQTYDVFVQYNSGTPQLALVAWTNDTTRATALTTQDGILVKTGATGDRYVGTVRTVTASQLNDSVTLRHVWNYYHRVPRSLVKSDSTVSWTYSTATIRQARADATNQIDVVVGVQEALLDLTLTAHSDNSSNVSRASGIGEDSTTTFAIAAMSNYASITCQTARLAKMPAIGRHVYSWNEWSAAVATTTFYGTTPDATPANTVSGLRGWIEG